MLKYTDYTDNELLLSMQLGDEGAYVQLYRRYWPVLYAHARNMLRNDEAAKDVVQDVFTALWHKRTDLMAGIAAKPYLYAAVRNHVLNQVNRGKLKDKYLDSLSNYWGHGEKITEEQVCYNDFVRLIEHRVERFSPRMKEIFRLSRNEGLTNLDIAQKLQISDHTVKKTIGRALKLLRTQISSLMLFLLF